MKGLEKFSHLHQKLIKENENQNLKKALQEEYIKEENTLIKLKEKKKHKQ